MVCFRQGVALVLGETGSRVTRLSDRFGQFANRDPLAVKQDGRLATRKIDFDFPYSGLTG